MTDDSPPTWRPKLTLVRDPVPESRAPESNSSEDPDPSCVETEPTLDGLLGSDEARQRDPLGAACTLVWLAHTALLEVSQGAPARTDEWKTTRVVVEAAVRYLVLAQAQRIVRAPVPFVRGGRWPLLAALRQLTQVARRSNAAGAAASEQICGLARRLDLTVQCLFDWSASGAIGVSNEEVFALARELDFVYRELQPLAEQQK